MLYRSISEEAIIALKPTIKSLCVIEKVSRTESVTDQAPVNQFMNYVGTHLGDTLELLAFVCGPSAPPPHFQKKFSLLVASLLT